MRYLCGCWVLVTSVALSGTTAAADWPRFRGPGGSGTSRDEKVPVEWSATKNLRWKLDLPGRGYSSPIIVGGHVFVTCYSSGPKGLERHLVCVDRQNGKLLWSRTVPAAGDGGGRGRGGRGFGRHGEASQTPVSDGERVYVLFGTSGVLAFDLKGNKLWQQNVGTESNSLFGSASSPILYKDLVIVTAGCESVSLRALDRKTGKEVWKAVGESLAGCYSTPLVIKNSQGKDELVISVPYEVWGLDPANGQLNWYAETRIDTAACTSLVAEDGIVYAVGGRVGGRTAIRAGGKDDITKTNVLWSKRGGSYVPSPVLHAGHLYWVNDRGIAYCVNARTGEEVASQRLRGAFYASPVLVKDKLYVVSRFDGTYVLEASPKLKVLAQNTLPDDSDFSGSPAISGGQLFLRSDRALYCIEAK